MYEKQTICITDGKDSKMKFTTIDGIEKKASRLVYGTPGASAAGDEEKAFACYDLAYAYGFRIFDNANSYGEAEKTLGKWLEKSSRRENIILLDKGCNPGAVYREADVFSAETIRSQVAESLSRLRTSYLDMYILHRDDPSKPVDEIVEVLNELHAAGTIGQFGGSNWTLERTLEANEYASAHGLQGFTVCSPNYSYARLVRDPWGGSVTISGNANAAFRKWLAETKMPVFNYSSLGRGYLSGRYRTDGALPVEDCIAEAPILEYHSPENVERLRRLEVLAKEKEATVSQIAMAWLLHQPLNLFPITSPTSEKHMRETVHAFDIALTDGDLSFLDQPIPEDEP